MKLCTALVFVLATAKAVALEPEPVRQRVRRAQNKREERKQEEAESAESDELTPFPTVSPQDPPAESESDAEITPMIEQVLQLEDLMGDVHEEEAEVANLEDEIQAEALEIEEEIEAIEEKIEEEIEEEAEVVEEEIAAMSDETDAEEEAPEEEETPKHNGGGGKHGHGPKALRGKKAKGEEDADKKKMKKRRKKGQIEKVAKNAHKADGDGATKKQSQPKEPAAEENEEEEGPLSRFHGPKARGRTKQTARGERKPKSEHDAKGRKRER